ncbi:S8/S53 family peptidase [Pararhodonellum marinum]|uniref:hypothetical protein n=1 Tax=Pararhodonellum marinum TaxID=2755358 RepID=UPI0018905553|nr:hypothetical protein [Pararhodonellum marinum]
MSSLSKGSLALIDGLPYRQDSRLRLLVKQSELDFDEEQLGVSQFRSHADYLLEIIWQVNPHLEVGLLPFFPTFGEPKEYQLQLASLIQIGVEAGYKVIAMALEGTCYDSISYPLRKAYEHAYRMGVAIVISAGNSDPFRNPLIHARYTFPVVGLSEGCQVSPKFYFRSYYEKKGFGAYGGGVANYSGQPISCSSAVVRFASILEKTAEKPALWLNQIHKCCPADAIPVLTEDKGLTMTRLMDVSTPILPKNV